MNQNESFNPYQPPKAVVQDVAEPQEIRPAHKGLRFGTYVIDIIGMYALLFVIVFLLASVVGDRAWNAVEQIPDFLLGVLLFFAYYTFFEGTLGRTPGKFLFRTIVVNEDGGKPTLGQVLLRTLCRFIPFEPFSVLLAERGWHDSLAGTCVIRVRR